AARDGCEGRATDGAGGCDDGGRRGLAGRLSQGHAGGAAVRAGSAPAAGRRADRGARQRHERLTMNRILCVAAFFIGLAAVAWVGVGYVGTSTLALTMT